VGPFLIVDDHSAVREGLGRILGTEFPGATLDFAASATDALAAIDAQPYVFAILDISMPGGDGLSLIQEIKDRSPRTRILVHTMHPEDQFGLRALRAGADGFITKDAPVTQILAAAPVAAPVTDWRRSRIANFRSCGCLPRARPRAKLPKRSISVSRRSARIERGFSKSSTCGPRRS
jgi:DNA-binding NarL/FixJ family response regulator